jgi:hypothetical protein
MILTSPCGIGNPLTLIFFKKTEIKRGLGVILLVGWELCGMLTSRGELNAACEILQRRTSKHEPYIETCLFSTTSSKKVNMAPIY